MRIELKDNEIKIFKIFRQYQTIWEKLFGTAIRGNKVILHFDHDGRLRKAEIPTIIEN